MLIRRIKPEGLLSFEPDTQALELGPLNVLIGPNGSGKSNLIEAIGLLQATPRDLTAPIWEGGGVRNWIWQGEPKPVFAQIGVVLENSKESSALKYRLGFAERGQRFVLTAEMITSEPLDPDFGKTLYVMHEGRAVLNYKDTTQRQLRLEEIDPEQSILAQRKDPDHHPELTYLGEVFGRIQLYREWSFGRHTPPCRPQPADLPNDFLGEDGRNLGLVLSRLKRESQAKARARILEALRRLYADLTDFDVIIEGKTVQVFLQEGAITIPATRLSDGTLRYLCLLAILCHPTPPPLVCIEEPELGLHPDILPSLNDLLHEASERCQLVVTTHSDILVDALTDTPDAVVVCEKHAGQTELRRLDKTDLTALHERGIWQGPTFLRHPCAHRPDKVMVPRLGPSGSSRH